MINKEQQNILSQDKNNSKSNKIQLTQNQLSHIQCEEFITNNQEEIKLNDQQQTTKERQNFYQSDTTLLKSLRSQKLKKKKSQQLSYSDYHSNPQDLNRKSQQSQQFIQTSITSQRENATITKNILVQPYPQAVNQSPSILERLLSMTGQTQKEQGQSHKTEAQPHDVAQQQYLNKQELPFPFQTAQLIKMFQELYKIGEMDKYQTEYFQQRFQIIQEKNEKIEQQIKDILQRFHKQLPENMQEQTDSILEQISKILQHHLTNLQCQNNLEIPQQTQLDIQFEDEFDFNQFEQEVQKKQKILLNLEIKPKNLQDFYNYTFIGLLKMIEYGLKNLITDSNQEIIQISHKNNQINEPINKNKLKKESDQMHNEFQINEKQQPKNVIQTILHTFALLIELFEQLAIDQTFENKINDHYIKFEQKEYKKLIKQIQEFTSSDYQQDIQNDGQKILKVNQIEWNEEIFEEINQSSSFKNKYFVQQKAHIFENLDKCNISICKLIDSNEKGDLFIGLKKLGESQCHEKVIKIIYSQTQEKKNEKHIQALDVLQYQYKTIEVNENTTHIFILEKEECLLIDKKIKLYMENIFKNLNFKQFGDLFQITIENKQNCQDQDGIRKKNYEQIQPQKKIEVQKSVCQENEKILYQGIIKKYS
ncbi:hypothetical protein ABPG72_012860 [Tetrahymena utriculariae]